MEQQKQFEEKIIRAMRGGAMLFVSILGLVATVLLIVLGAVQLESAKEVLGIVLMIGGILLLIVDCMLFAGLKIVNPNEAIVLNFFGKYYGTLKSEGFFWVNPFCTALNPALNSAAGTTISTENLLTIKIGGKKLSLKAMTLNNDKQKVNDADGNPIEIGVVVIWRIVNTARAVFNVDNYATFVSTQCDSAIRQVARQYPYDVSDDGDEKSLRGSSQEIAEVLKIELQERVALAGVEIMEARISHLAYAPEIAAAMLQRQQASAIIVARQKIVEGAVGMVEMALQKLSDKGVVQLDEERKAQMVSNLLVVLCGNRDAMPIVNSGSLY